MSTTNNTTELIPGNQIEPKGQIGSSVTLAYIVANIQNEMNDYSPRLYKRALQIVIDGMREMNLYHQSTIQVAYLVVPDSGIVYYPSGYIAYTKIGIPICGQIVTLSVNNNMLLNRATACGEDIRRIHNYGGGYPFLDGYGFVPHYNGGVYVGALYGAGGGFNTAYFREDKAMQRFEFDGCIPRIADDRLIVMEFEGTGISEGAVIRAECIDVLKNWYYWRANRHREDLAQSRIQQYKDEYTASVRKLRAFDQSFTLSQFMDVFYRNYKQTPKV